MRSSTLPTLCTAIFVLAASPPMVLAQQASAAPGGGADAAVALRFGTLGIGIEVNKLLTDHVGARIGANYFKLSTSKTQTNITYDAQMKLQAFSALLDFYPGSRGSFHLTGGLMTDPLKVTGTGRPTAAGTFTLNGTTYTSAQVGTLTGEAKFPGVGPYLGLGFGSPAGEGSGLRFLFDAGVVIGKAKVGLSATGAAADPTLAANLQAEAAKAQRDVDKYAKLYPVLGFGLAYHF